MKRDYLYLIFVKNWKTTAGGIAEIVITLMLWLGKIDMTDWVVGTGVVIGWIGAISKDADKRGIINPNKDEDVSGPPPKD